MQWITQIIPAGTDDLQLISLRVRALDMAHIENSAALGAFVPILPYTDYQKQIDGILNYISESGKLLAGYVDTSIAQQQALAGYYSSIIEQKQAEQKKQENTVDALRAQVNISQAEVNTAVENFKQALKDWKVTEAIKFGLTVATQLFTLGTSIAIPSTSISAVKDLGELAQGI